MLMPRTFSNLFGLIQDKTVPKIDPIIEQTRDGLQKAYIPNFLYKPDYGFPRYVDIPNIRRLATSPYVEMAISTCINELCSIEWDIVPKEGKENSPGVQDHIDHVKSFYDNPNTNGESFEAIRSKYLRDIFEIDSGVINKIFNMKGEMVELVCKDGGCLSYNNLVETENGFIPIGSIVKEKLKLKVKTYNFKDKKIEWKNIIGHKSSGPSNVWHRIKAKTNTKHRTIEAINHIIPNPNGDINSNDLNVGDIIYTQQNKLNEVQKQIIIGSLLGDCTLRNGNSEHAKIYFREVHCEKQKNYLLWKMENLKDFNPVYREYMSRYSKDYEPTLKCEFKTRADIVFEDFYDLKYPIFKKEIFDKLDSLALAVWLQDDGHMHKSGSMEIATHNIPKEVQEYGLKVLKEKWGIEGNLKIDKRCNKWFMNFNKVNGDKIKELIKDFIHPDMEYKFKVVGNPPINSETTLDILETEIYEIDKIYKLDTRYDIEVEDNHNFFCNGILVHNSFTKNPDIYGMMTDREDIIFTPEISNKNVIHDGWISPKDAREKAAYFQYGWITGAKPVPFGKKEIVWFEQNPRSDSIYGRSKIENLAETIQTLIYAIEENLEYFNDNSIPKGIIGLEGLDAEGLKGFREQWVETQRKKDTAGNWKKIFHHLPIVGTMPKFERLQFSNAELELLEGQKWWAKLVWASFGCTPTELGYSEDAKGLGNQVVQSNVFKKRVLYPILRLEEYKHNHEILPEFGYDDIEFKFMMFDVDEETKKANLYKLQIDTGIMTVNEVRAKEGLEPVKWGDDDPKRNMGTNINFAKPEGKEENNKKKESSPEKKSEEIKTYEDNPLILRENERPNEDRLKRSIVYLIKENQDKVLQIIDREIGNNKLKEIKSVDDIAKNIKNIITFEGIKLISDTVIKNTFVDGWESSEKQLNKNLIINKDVIGYIQEYTFNNIKSMTEEIMNDLRAELERGIMNGEGIAKIKDRVKKVFDVGETRAEAIARTETTRAENQGKLQAMKSSGEHFKKKWISAMDERTSDICRRLNNRVVGMNENFKDEKSGWEGPCPSAHVNCRSTIIFIDEEEEINQKANDILPYPKG